MADHDQRDNRQYSNPTPPPYQYPNYPPPGQQPISHAAPAEPFYKKTWFVVLLLIIFPPAGITLAWVFKKPEIVPVRVLLTVVSALILLIALVPKDSSASNTGTNPKSEIVSQQNSSTDEKEKKEVDKSELKTTLDKALAFDPAGYTPESFSTLTTAISEGQSTYSDASATEAEVDKATSAITAAVSALKVAFNPANYVSVGYTDLARNPDNYKGSNIVITGKVLQVSEGKTEINLRVATDMKYDDIVFIGYDPSLMTSRVLEDDTVTIYGMCIGLYSYTSTLGATISLPGMYADQIEIQ